MLVGEAWASCRQVAWDCANSGALSTQPIALESAPGEGSLTLAAAAATYCAAKFGRATARFLARPARRTTRWAPAWSAPKEAAQHTSATAETCRGRSERSCRGQIERSEVGPSKGTKRETKKQSSSVTEAGGGSRETWSPTRSCRASATGRWPRCPTARPCLSAAADSSFRRTASWSARWSFPADRSATSRCMARSTTWPSPGGDRVG